MADIEQLLDAATAQEPGREATAPAGLVPRGRPDGRALSGYHRSRA